MVFLCSDLDRTLLPNGSKEESPEARPLLRRIAEREDVTVAYVSGRSHKLIVDAIDEHDLLMPDFAIGDVGTTIYRIQNRVWERWEAWEREIDADWNGMTSQELAELLPHVPGLEKQEPEKQGSPQVELLCTRRCRPGRNPGSCP